MRGHAGDVDDGFESIGRAEQQWHEMFDHRETTGVVDLHRNLDLVNVDILVFGRPCAWGGIDQVRVVDEAVQAAIVLVPNDLCDAFGRGFLSRIRFDFRDFQPGILCELLTGFSRCRLGWRACEQ